MWQWIGGIAGLLIVLLFIWVLYRGNAYRRIFSNDHHAGIRAR